MSTSLIEIDGSDSTVGSRSRWTVHRPVGNSRPPLVTAHSAPSERENITPTDAPSPTNYRTDRTVQRQRPSMTSEHRLRCCCCCCGCEALHTLVRSTKVCGAVDTRIRQLQPGASISHEDWGPTYKARRAKARCQISRESGKLG